MRPNCRSRGVAIDDAIISGLAPGKLAPTEMVGKSICGSGETGNSRKATAPARAMAAVKSVVATGRWMNGEERLIELVCWNNLGTAAGGRGTMRRKTLRQTVEENVNHRRGVKREHLAEEQAANHGDTQGAAEFCSDTGAQGKRQAAE